MTITIVITEWWQPIIVGFSFSFCLIIFMLGLKGNLV